MTEATFFCTVTISEGRTERVYGLVALGERIRDAATDAGPKIAVRSAKNLRERRHCCGRLKLSVPLVGKPLLEGT